jgi:hypothetical protein
MTQSNMLSPRLNRLLRFFTGGRVVLALCALISFTLIIVHPVFALLGVIFLLILFGNTMMGMQEGIAHQFEARLSQERQTQSDELQRIEGLYQAEQQRTGELQRNLQIVVNAHRELHRQYLEDQQKLAVIQKTLRTLDGARSEDEVLEAQKRIEAQKLDGAIFHVTHWKAGSQWIRNMFEDLYPMDCIISAETTYGEDLSKRPIKAGEIYTPFYGGTEYFDNLQTDTKIYRFFVMRDLRDTLISAYFSKKNSHRVEGNDTEARDRVVLNQLPQEEGILWLLNQHTLIHGVANIQRSWLNAGIPVLRFEDMIANDVVKVSDLLLNRLQLRIDTELLARTIVKHRFQKKAAGRKPGEEDVNNHYRKGVAGDWQNYFTERIRDSFKEKFGQVLIATGYEQDTNW